MVRCTRDVGWLNLVAGRVPMATIGYRGTHHHVVRRLQFQRTEPPLPCAL